MTKKILLILSLFALVGGISHAAQLSIDPQFADARFEPADKLHAGCVSTATISITTAKEDINSLRLILSYEPEKLQILDIKPSDRYKSTMDTKIENDKVVISLLDAKLANNDTTKLFTVSFKSNSSTTESILGIHKPSYVMNKTSSKIAVFVDQKLTFAPASECEPDILPPTIELSKPTSTTGLLAVDSYFVFAVKDMGKGVDKDSLRIRFNGKTYTGSDSALTWQGDYLAFLPREWIPLNKDLDLQISVSDKQVYGGANTFKKTFKFSTATGLAFDRPFTPDMFRNLLGKMENIYASPSECKQLIQIITTANPDTLAPDLQKLISKVGCTAPILQAKKVEPQKKAEEKTFAISLFAALGWILFCLVFLLKLHYMIVYKKHKKLSKSLQSSQPTR